MQRKKASPFNPRPKELEGKDPKSDLGFCGNWQDARKTRPKELEGKEMAMEIDIGYKLE